MLDAASLLSDGAPVSVLRHALGESEHGASRRASRPGLLVHDGHTLLFVTSSLGRSSTPRSRPTRRACLHHAILGGLLAEGGIDAAVCAHHAELAGDPAAVLEYALRAARRAAVLGAHREAVAQYERALRFAGGIAPAERAVLLDEYTAELLVVNRSADALEASTDAVASWRVAGDQQRLALALCRRARVLERVPGSRCRPRRRADQPSHCWKAPETRPRWPCARDRGLALPEARRTTAVCRRGAVGFPVAERVGDEEATLEIMMSLGATRALPRGHGRVDPARRRVAARLALRALARLPAWR